MEFNSRSKLFRDIFNRLTPRDQRLISHFVAIGDQPWTQRTRYGGEAKILSWRSPFEKASLASSTWSLIRRRVDEFEAEQREAANLLEQLLGLNPEERSEAIESDERFRSLALCELVLARSHQVSFQDPKEGQSLATLGLQIARALDEGRYGAHLVQDLCGRAWTFLGSAYRSRSDLERAERSLLKAAACLHDTFDLLEKAHFLHVKALLRQDQRRFQEALQLREQAISIYRRFGERHLLGVSLCGKGGDLVEMGEPKLAIQALEEAVGLIDPLVEPRVYLAAHHNLALALVDQGRVLAAADVFSRFQNLYQDDLWSRARREWLRGRIAAGLGHLEEARDAFSSARTAFQSHDIPYDSALVSIELALVFARQGQTAEVKKLATEMVPIFKSRNIHREALAALTLFRQAADREAATVGTLQEIFERLQKAPRKA